MNLQVNNVIDLISVDSSQSTAHSLDSEIELVTPNNLDVASSDSEIEVVPSNNMGEEIISLDDNSNSDETNDIPLIGAIDFSASENDITAINVMLSTGTGIFGHANCILERRLSLLQGAGMGIFLREGEVIRNGECITQFDGQSLTPTQYAALSNHDKLHGYWIQDIIINGLQNPVVDRGLGSFFNSAVAGRCLSFVRPVIHNHRVYFMCEVSEVVVTTRL